MTFRFVTATLALVAPSFALPAIAKPVSPCGPGGCPTTGQNMPTTIIPSDFAQFQKIGDYFQNVATEINFGSNNATAFSLGFYVNFGGGLTDTAYISKDGLLSFGAPLAAYRQTSSLQNLNLPVIAPYYAKLAPVANDGRAGAGDVLVQTGFADVYADGGAYSMADLLPAVRITWNGVAPDGSAAVAGTPIYAQLVIAGSRDGSYSAFKFRYGTDQKPGEDGADAIAGFSLYGTDLEFGSPFHGAVSNFFEFTNGRFSSQLGTGAVPEPATWAQLIVGFGLCGYALRRRRARPVAGYASARM